MGVPDPNSLFQRVQSEVEGLHITVQTRSPLFLSVGTWKRHRYSLEDIEKTLYYFSPYLLWQTALLLGVYPVASAVKLSFSEPSSLIYSAKSIVTNKIMKKVQSMECFQGNPTVLDMKREQHVPPIPIHRAEPALFRELEACLPPSIGCLLVPLHVPKIFQWRGVAMVPMWFEDDALYCVRVVPEAAFHQTHLHHSKCITTRPIHLVHPSGTYLALEESWLLYADPSRTD